jgi:hypothetical protein
MVPPIIAAVKVVLRRTRRVGMNWWQNVCRKLACIFMSEMSLEEAQLFRVLGTFFGRDRVVWNMSVRTVCGGTLPLGIAKEGKDVASWVTAAGCLFTIVDDDDVPKMVVEFAVDHSEAIDLELLERQHQLPKLLESCGIRYVVLTGAEFQEILDPQSSLDLVNLLKDRLGLANEDESDGDDGDD